LQTAQFVDRVSRRFHRLPRGFFSHRARFGQCLGDVDIAPTHFGGEERRGGFGAARNFFRDGDLVLQAFLDAGDVRGRTVESLLGALQAATQRIARRAELIQRIRDTFRCFARCGFRILNARGEAEHRAIDRRHSAIKASHRELCAALNRFNALRETRGIRGAVSATNIPIIFAVEIGVREAVAALTRLARRRALRTRLQAATAELTGCERLVQIFAQAHALTSRSFARCFSHFGVNALDAPALRTAHYALAAFSPRVRGSRPTPGADSKNSRIAHDFAVSIKEVCVLMAGKIVNRN
jgi:hypothetical protein